MARLVATLSFEYSPAFYALLECAEEIAIEWGEERATAWAAGALHRDIDLFCRVKTETAPALRLIQGGRQ